MSGRPKEPGGGDENQYIVFEYIVCSQGVEKNCWISVQRIGVSRIAGVLADSYNVSGETVVVI